MNKYRKLFLVLAITLFLTSTVVAPLAEACTYKEGKSAKVNVTFRGWRRTSTGYRFTYQVQSGAGNDRIKSWRLYSTVFAKYNVIWASESYIEKNSYLMFTKTYSNNEKRTVSFTIGKGYKPIMVGRVCIRVQTCKSAKFFSRPGPVAPWK